MSCWGEVMANGSGEMGGNLRRPTSSLDSKQIAEFVLEVEGRAAFDARAGLCAVKEGSGLQSLCQQTSFPSRYRHQFNLPEYSQ